MGGADCIGGKKGHTRAQMAKAITYLFFFEILYDYSLSRLDLTFGFQTSETQWLLSIWGPVMVCQVPFAFDGRQIMFQADTGKQGWQGCGFAEAPLLACARCIVFFFFLGGGSAWASLRAHGILAPTAKHAAAGFQMVEGPGEDREEIRRRHVHEVASWQHQCVCVQRL